MSRKKWQARPLMLRRDVRFRAVVAGVSVLDRDLDIRDGFIYGAPDVRYMNIPNREKYERESDTFQMCGLSFVTLNKRGWLVSAEIDPDSVGEFTGLQDRTGRDIYEGDIVKWDKDQRLYVVEFRSGMFYASVEPCNPHIYGGFPLWCLCEEEQHCAIVGNIYDNPELIHDKKL